MDIKEGKDNDFTYILGEYKTTKLIQKLSKLCYHRFPVCHSFTLYTNEASKKKEILNWLKHIRNKEANYLDLKDSRQNPPGKARLAKDSHRYFLRWIPHVFGTISIKGFEIDLSHILK